MFYSLSYIIIVDGMGCLCNMRLMKKKTFTSSIIRQAERIKKIRELSSLFGFEYSRFFFLIKSFDRIIWRVFTIGTVSYINWSYRFFFEWEFRILIWLFRWLGFMLLWLLVFTMFIWFKCWENKWSKLLSYVLCIFTFSKLLFMLVTTFIWTSSITWKI